MRTKPHLNIGTMGHVDHGKTTLTAAITKVLAERGPGSQPVRRRSTASTGRRRRSRAASPSTSRTSSTRPPTRHYAHVDMPGHADYVKNMITGAAQVDGAILVVSALDGVMPQTARARAARPAGRRRRTWSSRSTRPTRSTTRSCSTWSSWRCASCSPSTATPATRCRSYGSPALRALEGDPRWTRVHRGRCSTRSTATCRCPARYLDAPFLMPIENVLTITGRGTVVTGAVERGTLRVGDPVEVVGLGADADHGGHRAGDVRQAAGARREAGDNAALLLRGVKRDAGAARPGRGRARQRGAAPAVPRAALRADARPRAAGTRRSSPTTGRSSTSAPRTWPASVDLGEAADGAARRHGRR